MSDQGEAASSARAPGSLGLDDTRERERLNGFVDEYLDALARNDPSGLRVSNGVRFSENNQLLELGAGAWSSATTVNRTYQIRAVDLVRNEVGYVGTISEGSLASLFALRLKVVGAEITEIETIVPRDTVPALFSDAAAKLTSARPSFSTPEPVGSRSSREELMYIANSYYEGLEQEDSHPVPFSSDCHRIENSVALTNNPDYAYSYVAVDGRDLPNFAAMGCMDLANSGMFNADIINARRFPIVDEELGVVFAFTFYQPRAKGTSTYSEIYGELVPAPGHEGRRTLVMLEVFKVVSGRITSMESVWSIEAPIWRSVWWR